jgi:LacI family transcriptional regulator
MKQPKQPQRLTPSAPELNRAGAAARRVALLVESSTSWGTGVIRGVAEYAAAVGPWLFYLEPFGRNQLLRLPKGWRGDGVIARVNNAELADEIEAAGLACVDISWFSLSEGRFPRVTVDERAVGVLAASHLIERGFRELAYIPPLGRPHYANELGRAVGDTARAAGCRFHRFERPAGERIARPRDVEIEALVAWLDGLPKPVGVVAFGDFGAREVTEAAWLAGYKVPDQIAVVGSEQDELSAVISNPPLSSVDVGAVRVGASAAEVLDRMMRGGPAPGRPVLLAPVGVIARESTDVLATEDPVVSQACRFIRERARGNIVIDDVVEHCLVSRRTLEQRFAAVLGCSPARMLRRVRVERACALLTDTDRSVPVIAAETGFGLRNRMTRAFQAELGISPQRYREEHAPVFRRAGDPSPGRSG